VSPEEQKFMAFDGLIAWTRGVVEQSRRTSLAVEQMVATMRTPPRGDWRAEAQARRLARRPKDWTYVEGGGIADASSTVDTRIGNRLDWVKLGAAAERLFAVIGDMEPLYPKVP
jgi:hypothetical protein